MNSGYFLFTTTVRTGQRGNPKRDSLHNQVHTVTQLFGALEALVWQGYLSLQMGVGALVESMRCAGLTSDKSPL